MTTVAVYRGLFRAPGVKPLAGAFVALGIASTMTPVALVLFARGETHSFATASLVVAASTAGGLIFGPLRGRLVDRRGAREAVLMLVVPDVITDVAFIVTGRMQLGRGLLIGLAFVAGAVSAPASTALRAVWSKALTASETRQAGYALMTMMQETNYIAGPLVAGIVIALASATAAVAVTAALSFLGALAFAAAAPPAEGRSPHPGNGRLPALAGAGIRTVVATSMAFGLTFGILDVAFPAFARLHGSAATSGILLSAFAVGSLVGGFLYGLRPAAGSASARYPPLCLLAAVGLAPLIAQPVLAAMVGLAILSGLCFAPITTCQFAAVDELSLEGHRAEAFTWLGTLYSSGLALGAAVSGQLLSHGGTRLALAAACISTLLAALVTIIRRRALTPPVSAHRLVA